MKTSLAIQKGSRAVFFFTMVAIATINTCMPIPVPASENKNTESPDFTKELKKWQGLMSDTFRDAFKALRANPTWHELKGPVSVDLREQNDAYTVRLSLPDRDLRKVQVTLSNDTLHVVAPEEGTVKRYEQSLVLNGVGPNSQPQIERRQEDNVIAVTVPKTGVAKDRVANKPNSDSKSLGATRRDHQTFDQMWRMQRDMDQIFLDSFKPFSLVPDLKGIFDVARFGSTYTIDDNDGNYVVRAFLPDRNMSNVKVTIDGQVVTIDARAEDAEGNSKSDKEGASTMAHYTQMITLPGPAKGSNMKVDSKDGLVVVSIPKA